MIADLKPYPEYKDSGVEWLGAVPSGWELRRAKSLLRKESRAPRPEDETVTCFRDGMVTLRRKRRLGGFTEAVQEHGYQGIRAGDLVVHGMDAFAGAVGVAEDSGKGSPILSVCTVVGPGSAEYFAEVVREMARSKWVVALAKGVRERSTDFRFDDLAVQRVPRPSAVEQYAIVDYVRGIRRCFRQLANLRTREIELLEEQYEGALLKAVTRGLRPNRRLKASGVDWLGEIPEDWDVAKLKSLVERFASGSTPRGGATVYEDHGIPFLRSQNIHFDGLRATTTFIGTQTHERMRSSRVLFGDVLLNITGASIGRACAVIEKGFEANVNQHICIIRPHRKRLESEYLAFALSTQPMQGLIEASATGASREGLRMDDIRDFTVPLPPRDEQLEIVDFIRTKSAAVRAALDLANRQIVHLAEYQTRLISDVVTGKLDVREAAAKLPDDPGELETVISDRLETASAADLA